MNILTTLQSYMVYPFVRYALIAGVLIALCSSLLGVTLVLKRFSYIGDGLSHVAFGAMAVATVVSVSNNMVIVMPVTIISAILLLSQNSATNIRGDAALAMIWLSGSECFFKVRESFGRRLFHAFRFDVYPDAQSR